jgi:hypothetical protein
MASQPAVKQPSTRGSAPAHAPARKASGRAFDYSRYRITIPNPEQFAQYLAGYPNKSGLQLYIYRLSPKIDFGLISQREHTIRKVFEIGQMNAEWVTREFGRGKYQFKLNDKMRDKGETEVCNMVFEVTDPERPPVYDPRTLCLGAPENIDEVNRLIETGALLRDPSGNPRVRTERDGPAQTAPSSITGSAPVSQELISRDLMSQVFISLVNKAMSDPAKAMEQTIEVARLLRPDVPAAPALTIDQIVEVIDRRLGRTAAAADPFAGWERVEALLAKARGAVGTAVSAATSDSVLSGISEVLKGAAVVIPQVISGLDFLQKQRAKLVVSINGNGEGAPAAGGAPEGVRMESSPPAMSLADRIAEIAQMAFMKMNEGTSGFDFAAYICQWHDGGLDVYRFLEPHGTVGVIGLLTMNPQAAPILADPAKRAQLEAFLDEFFTYDPDGGDIDEEQSGDGAPSAAA